LIWAILVMIGVPLWLCAMAIAVLIRRHSLLKKRPGNVTMRWREAGSKRWTLGNAVWVHDVIAFRARPAAWTERLEWVTTARVRPPSDTEVPKLKRLGDSPVIVELQLADGSVAKVGLAAIDLATVLDPLGISSELLHGVPAESPNAGGPSQHEPDTSR
jgi:hypothetical protein